MNGNRITHPRTTHAFSIDEKGSGDVSGKQPPPLGGDVQPSTKTRHKTEAMMPGPISHGAEGPMPKRLAVLPSIKEDKPLVLEGDASGPESVPGTPKSATFLPRLGSQGTLHTLKRQASSLLRSNSDPRATQKRSTSKSAAQPQRSLSEKFRAAMGKKPEMPEMPALTPEQHRATFRAITAVDRLKRKTLDKLVMPDITAHPSMTAEHPFLLASLPVLGEAINFKLDVDDIRTAIKAENFPDAIQAAREDKDFDRVEALQKDRAEKEKNIGAKQAEYEAKFADFEKLAAGHPGVAKGLELVQDLMETTRRNIRDLRGKAEDLILSSQKVARGETSEQAQSRRDGTPADAKAVFEARVGQAMKTYRETVPAIMKIAFERSQSLEDRVLVSDLSGMLGFRLDKALREQIEPVVEARLDAWLDKNPPPSASSSLRGEAKPRPVGPGDTQTPELKGEKPSPG